MTASILDLSASEIARRVGKGEISATECAHAFLARARAVGDSLGVFLDLDDTHVLEQAAGVDARRAAGNAPGPLAGVPVAIKDNICVSGRPTTAGSRILLGWVPPHDATVVSRLREAGAIAFGKTSCDEFAMGSSTEHCAFGAARNPWDPERVPGGSSGGSAAAVAARAAPVALGSDTGGSVRQPAAFCGVVGVKPTWGRVSRHGLVAFASSLDQVGPLARSVDDAALVLDAIAGSDPLDATSEPGQPEACRGGAGDEPFVFGVPPEAVAAGLSPLVRARFEDAVAALERAGGQRTDIALPHAEAAVAVYYVVATAEASSNLARYDGVRQGHRAAARGSVDEMMSLTRAEGFGDEVKRRILLGTHVLSAGYHDAYYRRANRVRTLIAGDFDRAFAACDVVVTPTAPTAAFALGEKTDDPLAMYLSDVHTVPASLAGLPAVSLPCGLAEHGMPAGVQLVGRRHAERALLGIAARLERELAFATRHAPRA